MASQQSGTGGAGSNSSTPSTSATATAAATAAAAASSAASEMRFCGLCNTYRSIGEFNPKEDLSNFTCVRHPQQQKQQAPVSTSSQQQQRISQLHQQQQQQQQQPPTVVHQVNVRQIQQQQARQNSHQGAPVAHHRQNHQSPSIPVVPIVNNNNSHHPYPAPPSSSHNSHPQSSQSQPQPQSRLVGVVNGEQRRGTAISSGNGNNVDDGNPEVEMADGTLVNTFNPTSRTNTQSIPVSSNVTKNPFPSNTTVNSHNNNNNNNAGSSSLGNNHQNELPTLNGMPVYSLTQLQEMLKTNFVDEYEDDEGHNHSDHNQSQTRNPNTFSTPEDRHILEVYFDLSELKREVAGRKERGITGTEGRPYRRFSVKTGGGGDDDKDEVNDDWMKETQWAVQDLVQHITGWFFAYKCSVPTSKKKYIFSIRFRCAQRAYPSTNPDAVVEVEGSQQGESQQGTSQTTGPNLGPVMNPSAVGAARYGARKRRGKKQPMGKRRATVMRRYPCEGNMQLDVCVGGERARLRVVHKLKHPSYDTDDDIEIEEPGENGRRQSWTRAGDAAFVADYSTRAISETNSTPAPVTPMQSSLPGPSIQASQMSPPQAQGPQSQTTATARKRTRAPKAPPILLPPTPTQVIQESRATLEKYLKFIDQETGAEGDSERLGGDFALFASRVKEDVEPLKRTLDIVEFAKARQKAEDEKHLKDQTDAAVAAAAALASQAQVQAQAHAQAQGRNHHLPAAATTNNGGGHPHHHSHHPSTSSIGPGGAHHQRGGNSLYAPINTSGQMQDAQVNAIALAQQQQAYASTFRRAA